MSSEHHKSALKSRGLRVTPVRLAIVQLLHERHHAVGQSDIEQKLPDGDRVTIYRALRDLESAGVIHGVTDGAGSRKFALCEDGCEGGKHEDHHVHFSCTRCEETYCLHGVPAPAIRNPRGYTIENV